MDIIDDIIVDIANRNILLLQTLFATIFFIINALKLPKLAESAAQNIAMAIAPPSILLINSDRLA